MFTRDLAFVIGNKFFISNMRKENRKSAIKGWSNIIKQIDEDDIIKVPENIYLEGGDVLVDGKIIYIGIGERTTMESVNFLKSVLDKNYTIIPLKLKLNFLHLDVVFTIIYPNLALIYKEGLEESSYKLLDKYDKIELTKKEQFELGTYVFVIDPNAIIINSNHKRIKEEIEKKITTISLKMEETTKLGGAFRCTT